MPTLSICIPTHDGRAHLLDRALGSATQQLAAAIRQRIRFCVSDNGSRDETPAVLERHRATLGQALVTHRFEANVGFTSNLLKVVDLAEGDFCWLLGSDDTLEPGALATVMTILDEEPDLTGITVNRINVNDADPPEILHDDPRVVPGDKRKRYESADGVFADLALLQDYISTQIVRRTAWQRAVASLGPQGIAAGRTFPHIAILAAMVTHEPRWRWHGEQLVRHRVGVGAVTSTFSLGVADYTIKVTQDRSAIWAATFGTRSPLYRAAISSARRTQLSAGMVVFYKLQPGHTLAGDLRLLVAMTRHYWRLGEFWTQSLPALLVPHGFVPVVVRARNILRATARRRHRGTASANDRAT